MDVTGGRIRVALIGCGRHATTNLYPALDPAGLAPVAVCARRLASARDAATRLRLAHAYDDVDALLRDVAPDAAVVCVPPEVTADVVHRCLDAGVPVFTEKPGAGDVAQARALADHAATARVPVVVGYMKRFAPAYLQAKALLDDPAFGEVTLASFSFVVGAMRPPRSLRAYLAENAVHHLDLARFLLGDLAVGAVSATTTVRGQHAVAVVAHTAAGAPMSLQLSTTGSWWQHNETVTVVGEGHSLVVEDMLACTHRPPERPARAWRPNLTVPLLANTTGALLGFVGELAHFADVVRGRALPSPGPADAAAALALVDELVARA